MGKTSKQNMVGKKYGFLTVLSEIELRNKNGHIMYNVKCDCGKEKSVLGASLRNGLSRSCNKCTLLTGSHGMWNTKVFKVWTSMKSRCSNANSPSYKNYGARGIKVCDRWLNSFENFYKDMGEPNELTLERIDVNSNYEPSNCKWASPKEQSRNRTNNVFYTYKKQTKCVGEWCELLKMPTSTFYNRIKRGWSIDEIIETPIRKINRTFEKDAN